MGASAFFPSAEFAGTTLPFRRIRGKPACSLSPCSGQRTFAANTRLSAVTAFARLDCIMSSQSSAPAAVRVDAWLWAIRAYKTRSAATAACRAGHVRLNGNPVKASQTVIVGDTIRVRESGWERVFEVRRLIAKRVGAEAASHCYTDHTPPRPVLPQLGLPQRDRGAGRPTKKDRRDMDKLRG